MWFDCQWESDATQQTIKLLQVTTWSSMMDKTLTIKQAINGPKIKHFFMSGQLLVKSV